MKRVRLYVILVLLLTLSISLVGCSSGGEDALIVAQGVDATTLDPGMHSETPTGNVERQMFDTLIELDEEMQFQPAVATSWEALSDTVWEVKIREGIKFHDGKELTSEDVEYSIDRILDPGKKSSQSANFSSVKATDVVDSYTLQITTKEPYPILPARLAALRVVPKHYVESVGDAEFSQRPIGSGPYKLVSWVKDDSITLEANSEYWRGAPAIKRVVFKPIPETASRVMALQAGQVDIAVNVPPHQVQEVEKSTNASIAQVPSSRIIFVQFMTGKPGPMSDPRVRLALNYAVDVQSIINNLLGGSGVPMSQSLSSMDFGYKQELQPYSHNPGKAKELLAEAGYANGFKLTFTAPNGRYMMDKEVAEAIKSQLEAVGLQVELKMPEWGVYVDQIMKRTLETDMWLIGWGNGLFDADGTLYSWFRSGQRFHYYDISDQRQAEMDRLLDLARTTMDNSKRATYYGQALEYIHEDVPWLMLYQQKDIYGVSNRVNWTPRADEAIILYHAAWEK